MGKGLDDDLNRFYDGNTVVTTNDFAFKHQGICHASHPPLKIPATDLVIYGGSCLHPTVKDADIYIGFDYGMKFMKPRLYPWQPQPEETAKPEYEVLFEIQDMSVPKDVGEFRNLIAWTAWALAEKKKVHCGCIGGHGRTGTFFAALVCEMTGEKDAISYVRENYCPKAVETAGQAKFLADNFGINPIAGSKAPVFVNGGNKKPKIKKIAVVPEDDVIARASAIPGYSIWE